jgi:lambda family phage portal protein
MTTRTRKPPAPAKEIAAEERKRHYMAAISSYVGASRSRPALANYTTSHNDANDDLANDLPTLRSRSRDLVRNAPLAGGAINTIVTNVIGTGLTLQPAIDAEAIGISQEEADAWQRKTAREFRLWAESTHCDITRHNNLYQLQSLAFRSALESGDVFILLPRLRRPGAIYSLTLQMVEADRVSNPNHARDTRTMIGGVEIDGYGMPTAYHIADGHPYSGKRLTWQSVPAWDQNGNPLALHIFDRRRPGQVRGVPILAPVIEPLKQLVRYTEAELQAAVISGAFSVFIRMDPEAFNDLFDDASRGSYLNSARGWDGTLNSGTLDSAGKAVNLLPGESIDSANPGRPNSEFDPFVQAILRQIGAQLELPFEVLIKHFTASYSAARAALLDAWRYFRGRRDWMASAFCQPVYEAWLREAISSGRIRAPGYFADPALRVAYSGAEWIGDGPGSLDPLKEAYAARERIEIGISTVSAESILHDGTDWEIKHRQRAKEVAARKSDGIEAATPVGQPFTATALLNAEKIDL